MSARKSISKSVKHDPREPIFLDGFNVFGCKEIGEARWACEQVKRLKPFYPNGYPRIVLNYNNRRQLVVVPSIVPL